MRAYLETEEKECTWSDRGEAISARSSGLVAVGSSVCGGKPTLRLGSKVRKGAQARIPGAAEREWLLTTSQLLGRPVIFLIHFFTGSDVPSNQTGPARYNQKTNKQTKTLKTINSVYNA